MAQDEGSVAGLPEYAEPPFVHIRLIDRGFELQYENLALWELDAAANELRRWVDQLLDEAAEAEEEAE